MRVLVLVSVIAGCAQEEAPPIRYRSTLQASTRGIVLHDGGDRGHAGMFDTNCPFETERGSVTGDYDLPDAGETVVDGGESTLGPETVVLTIDDDVYLLEKSTGEYVLDLVSWPDVDTVRITADGLVGLVSTDDGCAVEWWADGAIVGHVAVEDCDPGAFDVSRDGIAVVGGTSVVFVDPLGQTPTSESGRLVAFDDGLGVAYVAAEGGDEVRAVRPDGTFVWSTILDGAIRGLAVAGAHGAAVVTVERSDGSGVIDWLDGKTGELLAEVDTPSAAPSVSTSPDGDMIGLVLAEEVYFFEVDLDALASSAR
jgi:hypothetical protein